MIKRNFHKLFIICLALLVSCSKENNSNNNNNQTNNDFSDKIIYANDNGDIVLINDDGTNKEILVSGTAQYYNQIESSPENGIFTYTRWSDNDNYSEVYVYDLANKTNKKIISGDNQYQYSGVAISHSGKKVLLRVYSGEYWRADLAIIDIDGANFTRLSTMLDVHENVPTFSPDDSKIAFYAAKCTSTNPDDDCYYDVFLGVIDVNTKQITELASRAGFTDYPSYVSWSSDGKKISYVVGEGEDGNTSFEVLKTINADGTNMSDAYRSIPDGEFSYSLPWFGDNTKILFSTDNAAPANTYGLYSVNSDGTNLTNITTSNNYINFPMFNKDYTKILYLEVGEQLEECCDLFNTDVYVMDINSGTKTKVVSNDVAYPYLVFYVK
jgi:Tol biopolymer transport system component